MKLVPLGRWPRVILEGALKMAIFLGYMFLCTRFKDLHRVFEYHGAEHKTIACYEAGLPLTVENIRRQSRFHPRCGTSFMILVIIISIFFVCGAAVDQHGNAYCVQALHVPAFWSVFRMKF